MTLSSAISASPDDAILESGVPAPDDPIAARVLHEQINSIYHLATSSSSISTAAAAALCFILRDVTAPGLLAGWFVLIAGLATLRICIARAFLGRERRPDEIPLWERRFVLSLVVACLVWGIGGWLIMPAHSPLHAAAVYFFLMGLTAGAVLGFSAHARCSYITIWSMLMPSTAWFLMQDNVVLRTMAVGGLAYAVFAMRATSRLGFLLRRTFQLSYELQIAHENAQQLARIDDLSGMNNRRAFYDLGEAAFERAQARAGQISLVMIDIDHFKRINDTWGHAAGDRAIRAVAHAIGGSVRAVDIAGRLGGEEFAIILPETGGAAAALQAERLRGKVAALIVQHLDVEINLTCSFGVVELSSAAATLDALVHRADEALYRAKAEGRNRVVIGG